MVVHTCLQIGHSPPRKRSTHAAHKHWWPHGTRTSACVARLSMQITHSPELASGAAIRGALASDSASEGLSRSSSRSSQPPSRPRPSRPPRPLRTLEMPPLPAATEALPGTPAQHSRAASPIAAPLAAPLPSSRCSPLRSHLSFARARSPLLLARAPALWRGGHPRDRSPR